MPLLLRCSIAGALSVVSVPAAADPIHRGQVAAPPLVEPREPLSPASGSASSNTQRPSARSVGRAFAGAGLGLAGGVAGFALGFYAVAPWGFGDDDCVEACGVDRLGWAVVGGGAVAIVGLSFGTYAGSEWVGGDGSLGWTLLGGLGGAAVGAALGGLAARADGGAALTGALLVVPPLVGAALGYELSAADASSSPVSSAVIGVAPLPRGAALGLSGTF